MLHVARQLAALALLAPAAHAQVRSAPASSAKKEIDAMNTLWQAAIDARNADRSAAMYARDAVFMPPNAPRATGSGIRAAWAGMFKTPGIELKLHPQSVVASPDGMLAYDIGAYDFRSTTPKGPVSDHGKYLVVWKKVNGEWKAAADIFNSDLPAKS
jgi:ketosteroid isomerase-like protein